MTQDDETDDGRTLPDNVVTHNGEVVTHNGIPVIHTPATEPVASNFWNFRFAESLLGGAPINEYEINGPTYAGHSFATSSGSAQGDSVEALRLEMLARLDVLEALIRGGGVSAPNRGHNHPPELIEVERLISDEQFQEVVAAIEEIKREGQSPSPNTANVVVQISVLRRAARFIAQGTLFLSGAMITGVVGQEAGLAYTAHKQQAFDALIAAANAVSAWAEHIPSMF